MCGRYFIDMNISDFELRSIIEAVAAKNPAQGSLKLEGEIFPGDTVAVVARNRKLEQSSFPMSWGLKHPGFKRSIINARSETADTKPLFAEALAQHRCLIPASYYFEWEHKEAKGSKAAKNKYALRPHSASMLFLAGFYETDPQSLASHFVVLTREAAPQIRFIHERMPLMFDSEHAHDWLFCFGDYRSLLQCALTDMDYWKASA